jgi:hypothetical protein
MLPTKEYRVHVFDYLFVVGIGWKVRVQEHTVE